MDQDVSFWGVLKAEEDGDVAGLGTKGLALVLNGEDVVEAGLPLTGDAALILALASFSFSARLFSSEDCQDKRNPKWCISKKQ